MQCITITISILLRVILYTHHYSPDEFMPAIIELDKHQLSEEKVEVWGLSFM